MEVMVPRYLLNFVIKVGLSIYVMEEFQIQGIVKMIGLRNHLLDVVKVFAYVSTLGLCTFMTMNVRALVYAMMVGLCTYVFQYVEVFGVFNMEKMPTTFVLRNQPLGLLRYHPLGLLRYHLLGFFLKVGLVMVMEVTVDAMMASTTTSMVLQGTRLVPGELLRWRRSTAAIGPIYFLDIEDQLLYLAMGICPLARGLFGQFLMRIESVRLGKQLCT